MTQQLYSMEQMLDPNWHPPKTNTSKMSFEEAMERIQNSSAKAREERQARKEKQMVEDEELARECRKMMEENDKMFQAILDDPVEREKLYPDDAEKQELKIGPYEELYDPGLGKWSQAKDIEAFYGKDILKRVREELTDNLMEKSGRAIGKLSKQLYHEMKCMRERIKPRAIDNNKPQNTAKTPPPKAKKVVKEVKESPHDKKYFLKKYRAMIRNPRYREVFGGPDLIYDWLWSSVARYTWKDTQGYPLKENYYDKGFLACTMSLRHIAENCGMNKNTVKKHIDVFQTEGIIKIKHWVPEGKKRGQNIYILGEWKEVNGQIEEIFYRDQVYLPN